MVILVVLAVVTGGFSSQESQQFQFTLHLKAGWNLVSIPASPADAGVNNVFTASEVSDILTVEAEVRLGQVYWEWLFAHRQVETGEFVGPIKTIDPAKAYWILADRRTDITVEIPGLAIGKGEIPLVISLTEGQNMVPVVTRDIKVEINPDDYFSGVLWTQAWSYDPEEDKKTFIFPNQSGNPPLEVGRGYMVVLEEAGVLRP